jgi:hypothetical protein
MKAKDEQEAGTNSNELEISREKIIAAHIISPTITAALAIKELHPDLESLSLTALNDALLDQAMLSIENNSAQQEALLVTQSHTLDVLFSHLVTRSLQSKNLEQIDVFMKLALKAQSQSKSTVDALTRLTHPPVSNYVSQANIANGPQQVNNGGPSRSSEEERNLENELLETLHGERLEPRAEITPISDDQEVAALAKVDGTKKRFRKV